MIVHPHVYLGEMLSVLAGAGLLAVRMCEGVRRGCNGAGRLHYQKVLCAICKSTLNKRMNK